MVFNGNLLAEKIKDKLVNDGKLVGKTLVIFKTGNEEGVYVRLKRKMGEELGVRVEVRIINDLDKLKMEVVKAGEDTGIDGVMVQLPIAGADEAKRDEILRLIPLDKDVDGLNLEDGKFLPAAVLGVEKILEHVNVKVPNLNNLNIGVVGCKGVVGKALTREFKDAKGFDLGDDLFELKNFDVVVSATGEAGIIKPEMVKEGLIAIDLGYPKADFDEGVKEKSSVFTPVPGGVGPVTVVSLFENLSKTGYNSTS